MKRNVLGIFTLSILSFTTTNSTLALSSSDVSVKMISGHTWMDNSCTSGGPLGKVVAFRITNTKGSQISGLSISLGTITFTTGGSVSYSSGTPSFTCRTSTSVYIGNLAAGDSATAYYYVGYNCLLYPNNTNLTTDYLTFPVTLSDNVSGTVSTSFQTYNYVLRNANNNTITVLATSTDAIGSVTTISVAYSISNVKPGNIIDMELSTLGTFPAGYSILGCKITSSNITSDFAVGQEDKFYTQSAISNMSSGGSVTIEWYLKIEGASTGISMSNINPYIVSDAGSAQRWQANTTSFTGTSTPVNRITIAKRVNRPNVYVNDTVVYTIVVKNTSTTVDLTLDRLVDNLPRDYQFLYMETNTGVYSKLVTYSNCTQYPAYQTTGTLSFYGHAEVSPNVFSWVIPKNDSIKLIYSAKVSSTVGIKDTNKIAAYVGSTNVGNSFAVVNVFTTLPVDMIYFKADRVQDNKVAVSWVTASETNCNNYMLLRQLKNGETYTTVANIPGAGNTSDNTYYEWEDALLENEIPWVYKLVQYDYNGGSSEYFATVKRTSDAAAYNIYRHNSNSFAIHTTDNLCKYITVSMTDLLGRTLYTGILERTEGAFIIPYDIQPQSGKLLLLSIDQSGKNPVVSKVYVD